MNSSDSFYAFSFFGGEIFCEDFLLFRFLSESESLVFFVYQNNSYLLMFVSSSFARSCFPLYNLFLKHRNHYGDACLIDMH